MYIYIYIYIFGIQLQSNGKILFHGKKNYHTPFVRFFLNSDTGKQATENKAVLLYIKTQISSRRQTSLRYVNILFVFFPQIISV